MNKVFPVISILLLIAAGYELFKINTLTQENSSLKEQVTNPKQSGCDVCAPSTTGSVYTMNVHTLREMSRLYRNPSNFPSHIGGSLDAQSIWFSLDDLKNFILEIQKDTCGKSCPDKPLNLGLRLYYARYPKVDSMHSSTPNDYEYPDLASLSPAYNKLHTLFMVPTYDSAGGHKDFDPRMYNTKTCSAPNIIADSANRIGYNVLAFTVNNTTAKNHGSLCPPVCGPSSMSNGFPSATFEVFSR